MLININGKEYEFKYGWGALYIFEVTVPNQRFNAKSPAHLHLMYYCMLMNANKGMQLTQEEFVDALDNQPGLTKELNEAFTMDVQRWRGIQVYDDANEEDKKKEEES